MTVCQGARKAIVTNAKDRDGTRERERLRETSNACERSTCRLRARDKYMQASVSAVLTNSSFVSACSRAILKRRVATSCTESMLDAN